MPEQEEIIACNGAEARRREENFEEHQIQAKIANYIQPQPVSLGLNCNIFRTFTAYKDRQHEFFTAYIRIFHFVATSNVIICPIFKRAFICEKCRVTL